MAVIASRCRVAGDGRRVRPTAAVATTPSAPVLRTLQYLQRCRRASSPRATVATSTGIAGSRLPQLLHPATRSSGKSSAAAARSNTLPPFGCCKCTLCCAGNARTAKSALNGNAITLGPCAQYDKRGALRRVTQCPEPCARAGPAQLSSCLEEHQRVAPTASGNAFAPGLQVRLGVLRTPQPQVAQLPVLWIGGKSPSLSLNHHGAVVFPQ